MAENNNEEILQKLSVILADTHALGMATLSAHWNVVGENFTQLHGLFGDQYVALVAAADVIAEHIRAFDELVPCGYAEFMEVATVSNIEPDDDAEGMISTLLGGHELLLNRLAELGKLATAASDDATIDLVGERARAHKKAAWMLRSQGGV